MQISGMKKTCTTARLFHEALSLDKVTSQAPDYFCEMAIVLVYTWNQKIARIKKPGSLAFDARALIRCIQNSGMKKTCTTARLFHEALSLDNDTSQAPDCVCEMAIVLVYTWNQKIARIKKPGS